MLSSLMRWQTWTFSVSKIDHPATNLSHGPACVFPCLDLGSSNDMPFMSALSSTKNSLRCWQKCGMSLEDPGYLRNQPRQNSPSATYELNGESIQHGRGTSYPFGTTSVGRPPDTSWVRPERQLRPPSAGSGVAGHGEGTWSDGACQRLFAPNSLS